MMQTRDQRIYKVTLTGSIVNMVLLVTKFVAGILGNSAAMVADAVHSLSDFLTDIVVLAFVKLSSKPADHDHDYGHGKYETIATSIIGMALVVGGYRFDCQWCTTCSCLVYRRAVGCARYDCFLGCHHICRAQRIDVSIYDY